MGFTQRASCRPYKNCYKGGGSKKNAKLNINMPATRKSVRKSGRSSSRASSRASKKPNSKSIIRPKITVFQQSYSYSSNPEPGMPYGHLVRAFYENGKGKKMEANLNKAGKPINIKRSPVASTDRKTKA